MMDLAASGSRSCWHCLQSASPLDFIPIIVGLAACIVILFSGPLLVFAPRLLQAGRRGRI
ncbi:MAG: hypothetical protein KIS79_03440 [Burkholderiales bacterium]|nr:hypothetical protein [Burkholderiales bacterium]